MASIPINEVATEASSTERLESQSQGSGNGSSAGADPKLYEFKEQLLLLATLVATVTYVAGLNLPGGSWQQDGSGGYIVGDPILRDTHYRRYLAFYYCNATALATSLVISLILIILPRKSTSWTVVLRAVMALDLLGLMGAYGAGSSRDTFTTVYSGVAFSFLVYVILAVFFSYLWLMARNRASNNGDDNSRSDPIPVNGYNNEIISDLIPILTNDDGNEIQSDSNRIRPIGFDNEINSDPTSIPILTNGVENEIQPDSIHIPTNGVENQIQANSIRIPANANGSGAQSSSPSRKHDKEKIDLLMLLATFVVTITYVAGLSPPGGFWSSTQDGHHPSDPVLQARGRFRAFFICNTTSFVASLLIIVLLLEKKLSKTISVRFVALYGLIAVALLGLMGAYAAGSCREADNTIFVLTLTIAVPVCVCLQLLITYTIGWKRCADVHSSVLAWFKKHVSIPRGTSRRRDILHEENTRYLVMLLATLVVTITYQAGLDPPGGLWEDDHDGHKIGHPVLQLTHPTRYRVFFYSNSATFVTSLVVIMMLQSRFLLKRHTLEAALVLDLFGLITAYGAGSTRDVKTSIYIVALAGLVLVYVIVHITIRDHDPEPADDAAVKDLDSKRKLLLLAAILAATLTYQAGLTPPGGFWSSDDEGLGRRSGFPVLLDNYPRRYEAFFYCNSLSFMASVTLILLLVNPKLYRPGIRCYALYVCMVVGMFGLMGAYAAGSSRHLKTSLYVLTLVGAVLAFIASQVAIFWIIRHNQADSPQADLPDRQLRQGEDGEADDNSNKEKYMLEYLMLLGILAASMTYQTGLKPPGGLWQDNDNGHSAGNPILHDINKHRYHAFFYSNSTSFMASIVVVVMLLPLTTFHNHNLPLWPMHTAILLDMFSLLVAYAAGSNRKWETSRNVILLIIPVLAYIAVYATMSVFYHRKDQSASNENTNSDASDTVNDTTT
ncbi:hypothetical protein CFC21_095370 [Triticum aestivum]|uniref:PGG domain-containing protein n=2 Tax=Triticum aestivum TaxID=4565 RepID=A0A9R1MXC1_WHEAT|nr:uncharacterized protein LOC123152840 [Triticum aestivum]KAF7092921.1 hypothetical protein CFC21_095370 [Triticum aestivum]